MDLALGPGQEQKEWSPIPAPLAKHYYITNGPERKIQTGSCANRLAGVVYFVIIPIYGKIVTDFTYTFIDNREREKGSWQQMMFLIL
jgi:hypothetical protein